MPLPCSMFSLPPCGGSGGLGTEVPHTTTPTQEGRPLPSPQGGGEMSAAPARLNLAPRESSPAMTRMNSVLRRMNPCAGRKNSLLSEAQGIGCKLLNPLGHWLPKPPKEAAIGRNFQKFPAIFPAAGNARIKARRSFDMIQTLATPQEKYPLDPSHPHRWRRHWRHGGGVGAP